MCNTYIGGFHSLRQMLLGFLLFALVYSVYVLSSNLIRASPLRCTLASAATFVVVAGAAAGLPHEFIATRLFRLFMCTPLFALSFLRLISPPSSSSSSFLTEVGAFLFSLRACGCSMPLTYLPVTANARAVQALSHRGPG